MVKELGFMNPRPVTIPEQIEEIHEDNIDDKEELEEIEICEHCDLNTPKLK